MADRQSELFDKAMSYANAYKVRHGGTPPSRSAVMAELKADARAFGLMLHYIGLRSPTSVELLYKAMGESAPPPKPPKERKPPKEPLAPAPAEDVPATSASSEPSEVVFVPDEPRDESWYLMQVVLWLKELKSARERWNVLASACVFFGVPGAAFLVRVVRGDKRDDEEAA